MRSMNVHLRLLAEADGEVVVHCLVVQEIFLDNIALVAEAQNKLSKAIVRVRLHDVPQNRPTTHLHHGLRTELRLFAQTRSETAAEDHRLHRLTRVPTSRSYRFRSRAR